MVTGCYEVQIEKKGVQEPGEKLNSSARLYC